MHVIEKTARSQRGCTHIQLEVNSGNDAAQVSVTMPQQQCFRNNQTDLPTSTALVLNVLANQLIEILNLNSQ
jgi:hypothetical protein